MIAILFICCMVVLSCPVIAENGHEQQQLQLYKGYYRASCPMAETVVRSVMEMAMKREPRNAASVLRLQYHDCLVNGCDGSLLLDETSTMAGEKDALSNINSLRAYDVIDEIKEALEKVCPNTVSCADILIIAARDAVILSGGPFWEVYVGRKDSLSASQNDSNDIMPSPRSNVTALVQLFKKYDLSVTDLVALSGTHTIGKGRCFSIMFRLYNQSGSGHPDPTINCEYRHYLDTQCPHGVDGNVTLDLDVGSPTKFDNSYFKNLVLGQGLLNSDQVLFSTLGETRDLVYFFSQDESAFFSALIDSMIKLGNLPPSSNNGEIRKNCRRVN
ncbi:hypothetical protein SUGI_0329950 [Cryptomeria japonica]|nr:hypothetical protein SUGI_0329950 [Cryptomeria japonica]